MMEMFSFSLADQDGHHRMVDVWVARTESGCLGRMGSIGW